jgi:hypothetical protein
MKVLYCPFGSGPQGVSNFMILFVLSLLHGRASDRDSALRGTPMRPHACVEQDRCSPSLRQGHNYVPFDVTR